MKASDKNRLVLLMLIFSSQLLFAQVSDTATQSTTWIENAIEFFTFHPNHRKVQRDSSIYASKFILAPIVSYSPEESLGIGTGSKFLFKFKGSGDETRTSNMPMSLLYTLENQFVFHSGYEIFFNQEKWVLEGNVRLKSFPTFMWGIGNDTPNENKEKFSSLQVEVEPILLKQMFLDHLFVGLGFRINTVSNVQLERNGIVQNLPIPGIEGSTSLGGQFGLLYDSRDNLLNARKGAYIRFTHGQYDQILFGTHTFQSTRLDCRYFVQPFKKKPKNDDVIAFQFASQFNKGNVPLAEYARLGSKEIMRGLFEGRYIDKNFMATQVEYRKRIVGNLGMVGFVAVGDVAPQISDFNIPDLKVTGGLGVRYLIDKKENLNIRFDVGLSSEKAKQYINIAEAF